MPKWVPILRRRGCSVLFYSFINQGYRDAYYQEILGIPKGVNEHIYVDGWVVLDLEDADHSAALLSAKASQDTYLDYFVRRGKRLSDDLFEFGKDMRDRQLSSATRAELLAEFCEFSSRSIRLMPFLTTLVLLQDGIERRLAPLVAAELGLSESDPALALRLQSVLLDGSEAPLATLATRELLSIAAEVRSDYPNLAAALVGDGPLKALVPLLQSDFPRFSSRVGEYLRAYDFLGTDYYVGAPLDVTSVLVQLQAILRNDRPMSADGQVRPASWGEPLSRLVAVAQRLHFLRQYRIEALFKSGREMRGLLVEVGERLGLTYSELLALQFQEIIDSLIEGRLVIEFAEVASRLREFGVHIEHGEARIVIGKDLAALRERVSFPQRSALAMAGVTAVVGDATGPARVITILDDIHEMVPGDVLVVPMTSPYHVPAMNVASAIVTDEGGILSHAAIVARELGIPCIVGVKDATTSIRNGQRLHVRARASGGQVDIVG